MSELQFSDRGDRFLDFDEFIDGKRTGNLGLINKYNFHTMIWIRDLEVSIQYNSLEEAVEDIKKLFADMAER